MALRDQLNKIATEINNPCVTISLNTHRTHPENAQDAIILKNLLKEAEERVINEYGKRDVASLLEKINNIEKDIDHNYNLDSLHLYLSNDTQEIVRSPLSTYNNLVHIGNQFAVRSLIKAYNRSEEYLLMVLSQSGVQLYHCINDGILEEIRNDDFPFSENKHYSTHADKRSDPKHVDDLVKEFLNRVDKAVNIVAEEHHLKVVVACVENNYHLLQEVADKPSIYKGYFPLDYNNAKPHDLVKHAAEFINNAQHNRRKEAIGEMKEAVAHNKVVTDLQEIYQAAIDGRGEILIVHSDFAQPVKMIDDRSFELVDTPEAPGVVDDITSNIAWEVLSKKGTVFFTHQDEIKDLGKIVLKTRY